MLKFIRNIWHKITFELKYRWKKRQLMKKDGCIYK